VLRSGWTSLYTRPTSHVGRTIVQEVGNMNFTLSGEGKIQLSTRAKYRLRRWLRKLEKRSKL
ncbi:TPA: hypothetical protein ACNH05_003749, partial [Acinetobacter baumannii]